MEIQDFDFADKNYSRLDLERARAHEEKIRMEMENNKICSKMFSISMIDIPESKTVYVGETINLFEYDSSCGLIKPVIKWKSTNTKIAEVDADTGLITVKRRGKAKILANFPEHCGIIKTCILTVKPPIRVRSVNVRPKVLKIKLGDCACAFAVFEPSNATLNDISWVSKNKKIAVVDAKEGIVSAVGIGKTKIYAVSSGFFKKCDFCTVIVER